MKPHLTAETSIANYHLKIKGSHEDFQDEVILEAVRKFQPCTGRMIWKYLNDKIENSSVARSLNNLKKKTKIISPFKDNCPVTGNKVQWYSIIEENGQINMF